MVKWKNNFFYFFDSKKLQNPLRWFSFSFSHLLNFFAKRYHYFRFNAVSLKVFLNIKIAKILKNSTYVLVLFESLFSILVSELPRYPRAHQGITEILHMQVILFGRMFFINVSLRIVIAMFPRLYFPILSLTQTLFPEIKMSYSQMTL